MRVQIKFLTSNRRGVITAREAEAENDFIRFGRKADCDVRLADPRIMLQQASLLEAAGRYYFVSDDAAITELHGLHADSNEVSVGSKVRLGPYELNFVAVPEGFDVAISVELIEPLDDGLTRMRSSALSLDQTRLRMPVVAWTLSILAFMGILAWPFWAAFDAERVDPENLPIVSGGTDGTPGILAAWEAGSLTGSHRFLSANCTACHAQPFAEVANTSCLNCHDKAEHHVDPDEFKLPRVQKGNCTACHQEHGAADHLVIRDDRFCVSCHGDLKAVSPETTLVNIDRDMTRHPPFRATVVTDASTGQRTRIDLVGTPDAKEKSNLRFPHHVHVAKTGIKIPGTDQKQILECVDCHTPDAGGLGMQAIDMETHCGNCHKLEFDPAAAGRTLPHAAPKAVHALIYDFYLGQEAAKARDRLEYGTSKADPTGKDTELHRALARARERQQGIVEFVFDSICGTCHEPVKISDTGDFRWSVEPVNLSSHWYPKARFDHGAHRTIDCAGCHDAKGSTKSSDILLPTMSTCLKCHGPVDELSRVPTTCGTCHEFHVHGLPSMAETADAE